MVVVVVVVCVCGGGGGGLLFPPTNPKFILLCKMNLKTVIDCFLIKDNWVIQKEGTKCFI